MAVMFPLAPAMLTFIFASPYWVVVSVAVTSVSVTSILSFSAARVGSDENARQAAIASAPILVIRFSFIFGCTSCFCCSNIFAYISLILSP